MLTDLISGLAVTGLPSGKDTKGGKLFHLFYPWQTHLNKQWDQFAHQKN